MYLRFKFNRWIFVRKKCAVAVFFKDVKTRLSVLKKLMHRKDESPGFPCMVQYPNTVSPESLPTWGHSSDSIVHHLKAYLH